jgi:hypothetical protein
MGRQYDKVVLTPEIIDEVDVDLMDIPEGYIYYGLLRSSTLKTI